MEIADQNKPAPPKIGSEHFVKTVDELAAKRFVDERRRRITGMLFDDDANKKYFKKRLRGNSKKYRKTALVRANYKCEVCGFGNKSVTKFGNILHFHHIVPICDYWDIYYGYDSMPDSEFEKSNLVVLCPNCHAFVHRVVSQNDKNVRKGVFFDFLTLYGNNDDELFFRFVKITNRERIKAKTIFDEVPDNG